MTVVLDSRLDTHNKELFLYYDEVEYKMEYKLALLCLAQNNRGKDEVTLLELILPVNLFTVAVF